MHTCKLKRLFLLPIVLTLLSGLLGGCQGHPVAPDVHPENTPSLAHLAIVPGAQGGDDDDEERGLDLDLCDPEETTFTLEIDNAFFPLPVGQVWHYEGDDEGAFVELQITVFDQIEVVAGVTTRVVEEREWIDGELVEVSQNYYAQAETGTVCYFGEAVDIYEDGEVISHDGSWRADDPGNDPGIFMPPYPKVGAAYQQEVAPGIAEDRARIVARGETVTVPYGTFERTLRVRDFNPLDGGAGEKVYADGTNLIVDGPVQLVRIE
jgi:hypothetical protein